MPFSLPSSLPRGFIAGPYVWTYNGRSIGISEDGWRLNQTNAGDPIRGDNLGDSMQDYVYRGGDVTIETVLQEWNFAIAAGELGDSDWSGLTGLSQAEQNINAYSIFWPWTYFGNSGQVGRLASMCSAPLVGVPAPGTTAAQTVGIGGIDYTTLTASYAVLAPGYNVSMLFAARLRNIPVRLQCLPSPLIDSGSENWFIIT